MFDFDDFWYFIKGFILIIVILFVLIFIPVYFLSKASCIAQTEEFESRFGIYTDCQVKVEGKWIQWDNYIINREDAGE